MKLNPISLFVSLSVFFLSIQAQYWPLVYKPGSTDWWQVKIMADIGTVVGLPGLLATYFSQSNAVGIFVNIVWAILFFYVMRTILKNYVWKNT